MYQTLVDLTFPHDYEISLVDELPPGPSEIIHHYLPAQENRRCHDGIIVRVKPNHGVTWLGTFTFGFEHFSPPAFSGLFSCPNPQFLCVVSQGRGYIVKADDPQKREWVPGSPILDARISVEQELIVFTDNTSMTAYGRQGEAWRSKQLSLDGIWDIKTTANTISGMAIDLPDTPVEFVVDLRTGNHQGGTSLR